MDEPQSLADRVSALQQAHAAEFSRTPQADGTVVVVLQFPDGDRISGRGATTALAVTHLEARVKAFVAAQETTS